MPHNKSSTTWAAMRAGNSTTTSSGPSSSSASPQAPLWKARDQHIHKPAPEGDAFPTLGAASTALSNKAAAAGAATGTASQHSQQQRGPAQGQQQQQQHFQQDTSSGLLRRRSLSAPSLAQVASNAAVGGSNFTQQAVQQPYSAVVGSSTSRSAGSSRSNSVERRHSKQHRQHVQHPSTNATCSRSRHGATDSHHSHDKQQQQQQQQQQQLSDPQTGLQLLQECHPWCDAVLLHEILQTFNGDVVAALEALQQMLPADGSALDQQRGSSDGSSSDSSITGSDTEVRSAAVPSAAVQLWPAGPEEDNKTGGAQLTSSAVGQQLGRLGLVAPEAPHGQQLQQVADQDTYRVLRGEAVKLSHKYRKASRRAAAARARGDFSAAAQLASEVVSLKAAADAAHAAAAIKIEVANNADNPDGLWELDLHGLHVSEATHALQERVQLLQDIAGDLKKQLAVQQSSQHNQQKPSQLSPLQQQHKASSKVGTARGQVQAAGVNSAAAGGNRRQAVLTSLLLPDGGVLSWEQQLSAMRQELRVIVGKGLHSSGGEASLPRVVEQWLLQHGYKYIWRGGCIGVQLKLL